MALVDAAGTLDRRPSPRDGLRRKIVGVRAAGKPWKALAAELGSTSTTTCRKSWRRTGVRDLTAAIRQAI